MVLLLVVPTLPVDLDGVVVRTLPVEPELRFVVVVRFTVVAGLLVVLDFETVVLVVVVRATGVVVVLVLVVVVVRGVTVGRVVVGGVTVGRVWVVAGGVTTRLPVLPLEL